MNLLKQNELVKQDVVAKRSGVLKAGSVKERSKLAVMGLAIAGVLSQTQLASASFFESGIYADNQWKAHSMYRIQRQEFQKQSPDYRDDAGLVLIQQNGSRVLIRDLNARRNYEVNLASSDEQQLPMAVMRSIQENPMNGPVRNLIQNVSIQNVRVEGNQLTADFKIAFNYRAPVLNIGLSGAVLLTARIVKRTLLFSDATPNPTQSNPYNRDYVKRQRTQYEVLLGDDVRIDSISTDIPELAGYMNSLQVFGDLLLKGFISTRLQYSSFIKTDIRQ